MQFQVSNFSGIGVTVSGIPVLGPIYLTPTTIISGTSGTSVQITGSNDQTGLNFTGISGISLLLSGNTLFINGGGITGGGGGTSSGTQVQITGSTNLTTANFTGISGINLILSGNYVFLNTVSLQNQITNITNGTGNLNYVTPTQSGTLTGVFARLNSNNIFTGINSFSGNVNLIGNAQINFPSTSYINDGFIYDQNNTSVIEWYAGFRFLNDTNGNNSINWGLGRLLFDVNGHQSIVYGSNGNAYGLYSGINNNTSQPFLLLDWGNQYLYGGLNGLVSVDWTNKYLYGGSNLISIDYNNRILSGNWSAQNLTLSGKSVTTGGPYAGLSTKNTFSNTNIFTGSILLGRNAYINSGYLGTVITEGDVFNPYNLDWILCNLFDTGNNNVSMDWSNRYLYDSNAIKSIDYNNRILSGNWTSLNFITTGQTGNFGGGGNTSNFALLTGNNNFSGTENIVNNSNSNLITTSGNLNNYQQINVQNFSGGNNASSDLVCTNDIGNQNIWYVDLGINSSQYTGQFIGNTGDAYCYSLANDFYIGNASGNRLYLFAGNQPYSGNQAALTIFNNNIGINNTTPVFNFDISGNQRILLPNLSTLSSLNSPTGIGLLLGNPTIATLANGGGQGSPSLTFSGNYYTSVTPITGSSPSLWRIYSTLTSGSASTLQTQLNIDLAYTGGNFTNIANFNYNNGNGQPVFNCGGGVSMGNNRVNSALGVFTAITSSNINSNGNPLIINSNSANNPGTYNLFNNSTTNISVSNSGNTYLNNFTGNFTSSAGNGNYIDVLVSPIHNFTGPQSGTIYDLRVNPTTTNISGANHYLFDVSNSNTSLFNITSSGINHNVSGNFLSGLNVNGIPVIAATGGTSPTSGTLVVPVTLDVYGGSQGVLGVPAGWLSFTLPNGLTGRLPYY